MIHNSFVGERLRQKFERNRYIFEVLLIGAVCVCVVLA